MPQAAAAVITKWIVGAFGIGKFAAAVIELALAFGITKLANSIAGRDDKNYRGAEGREVNVRGSMQPRQIIYGQIKTAGHIAFYTTVGPYLYFVVVHAGHQCHEMREAFLDDRQASTINPTTGEVTDDPYISSRDGLSKLYIFTHLGTAQQTADANMILNLLEWSAGNRGSGIAYTVFRLEYDEEVWPSAAPQLFQRSVKGRRVYDQRKDSTNGGSGTHRINDATTWEYSENWALIRADSAAPGAITFDA